MTRTYLPFNFPGDKSYVEALLERAVAHRDELQAQADASEDRSNDTLLGFIEKNQAAQEIVDTLMLWLNS